PLTVFPSQNATFGATIYALNGYNAAVNLSCTAGSTSPPSGCSISPNLLLPTPGGTPFLVNAAGNAGDYAFNVHAVGLDPLATTHDSSLTLHVIDFALGIPSPASVSVIPGNSTTPVSFVVSALGAFNATVTLSCSGLPTGATCQFQPASVVPTSGTPASVTLNISTSSYADRNVSDHDHCFDSRRAGQVSSCHVGRWRCSRLFAHHRESNHRWIG